MIKIYLIWDYSIFILLLSSGFFGIAFTIGLYQYINRQYLFEIFLILGCLSGILWTLFYALFNIFVYYYPIALWNVHLVMPIAMSFFLILALDFISRDFIDLKKIIFFTTLGTILITLYILNKLHPIIAEAFGYFNISLTFIVAFIWFGYTIKIYLKSPKLQKKYSTLNLIGGVFIGILTPIVYILGAVFGGIFSYLNYLFVSIGLLFCIVAFAKEPKLSGILPFRVFNLTIIDAISGNSVFSHDWDKKEGLMNDTLFSSLLQAISAILNEAIRKGNVREISLDEAVIILKRSKKYPVAYVLIASKSSKTLRHALDSFTDNFDTRFSKYFSDMSNLEVFLPAYEIIHESFPFVPEYN